MDDEQNELDVLFGTEEEAIWLKFQEARTASIKQLKESLMIETELLKVAEEKLKGLEQSKK